MSAIPPKQLLSPTPVQASSPGHSHSRSVSHSRPPSHSGAGSSADATFPATTTSSSSASSIVAGLAPGTPDVFDGSVRQGTCKFFNSQKGYGFINDARAHELNGEEGPSALLEPADRSVFVHYTAISGKSGFRSLAEARRHSVGPR